MTIAVCFCPLFALLRRILSGIYRNLWLTYFTFGMALFPVSSNAEGALTKDLVLSSCCELFASIEKNAYDDEGFAQTRKLEKELSNYGDEDAQLLSKKLRVNLKAYQEYSKTNPQNRRRYISAILDVLVRIMIFTDGSDEQKRHLLKAWSAVDLK